MRPLTIRMPADERARLEAAAKEHGWTVTDELSRRLRSSFSREREERRDPAMRGLCYLIAELAHHVSGPHAVRGKSEVTLYDWRSDPFFYRAFKIAVARLLDALDPPGPIKAYKVTAANKSELDSFTKRFIDSFKTPEARAELVLDYILAAFRTIPRLSAEQREEQRKLIGASYPSLMHEFYGMPDAARDLAVKPQSGETTPLTLNVQMFGFDDGAQS